MFKHRENNKIAQQSVRADFIFSNDGHTEMMTIECQEM